MAAADYKLCDVCSCKAFYDSNVDYQKSTVVTLCYECDKEWDIEIKSKLVPEDTEVEGLKAQIHTLKSIIIGLREIMEEKHVPMPSWLQRASYVVAHNRDTLEYIDAMIAVEKLGKKLGLVTNG